MFQASPKKIFRFGTRITELNALGILFTLFGAFWYRYENEMVEKNGHSTKRGVLHTRPWEIWLLYRGSRNLFAVLVNFCWFCVPLFWGGRCLWLPCFQKKHFQPVANKDYSVCLRCAIWTLAQPWILLPQFILEASKTSSSNQSPTVKLIIHSNLVESVQVWKITKLWETGVFFIWWTLLHHFIGQIFFHEMVRKFWERTVQCSSQFRQHSIPWERDANPTSWPFSTFVSYHFTVGFNLFWSSEIKTPSCWMEIDGADHRQRSPKPKQRNFRFFSFWSV